MTLTSHEVRKSMTVAGPIWTCHKCDEPWPCETENLGQQVENLELAIDKALRLLNDAEVYDGTPYGFASVLTPEGAFDIFEDDGAFGVLERALGPDDWDETKASSEAEQLREGVERWLYDPWKYGIEGSIAYFNELLADSTGQRFPVSDESAPNR